MKWLAVVSGKGGVGKSTISSLISLRLSKKYRTLLLDFDLTGPSNTFNTKGQILKTKNGLEPVMIKSNLFFLSMALMIRKDDSVIWRGPRKMQLLEMFYQSAFQLEESEEKGLGFQDKTESENELQKKTEADKIDQSKKTEHSNQRESEKSKQPQSVGKRVPKYDYVIVDTPPGLTAVHQFIKDRKISPLLVTTSQNVAISDSINQIDYFEKIFGLIENLSGIECKKCKRINNIYSKNGGKILAEEKEINFFGSIEIDQRLSEAIENGTVVDEIDNLKILDELDKIIEHIEELKE